MSDLAESEEAKPLYSLRVQQGIPRSEQPIAARNDKTTIVTVRELSFARESVSVAAEVLVK